MKVTDIVTTPFEWGAALRHRRAFHPVGTVAHGDLQRLAPDGHGLPMMSGPVLARVSKGVGLPGGWPDLAGLAWRLPAGTDGEWWDVLTVSVFSGSIGRVVLRPVTTWSGVTFSTLMPLDYQGHAWWVRARIDTPIQGDGLSLDAVARQVSDGGVVVDVEQAQGTGGFEPLARLTLDTSTPDDVTFDPIRNEALGVHLAPNWLTDVRRAAYHRSRKGRHEA